MFDRTTEALIRRATPLEGLDVNDLPQELTAAFATIAAARLRAQGGNFDDLPAEVARLRRLARTYEAFVALASPGHDREAVAFVAATAYRLAHRFDTDVLKSKPHSHLGDQSIGDNIASLLLYLIAGQSAEAAEAASTIAVDGSGIRQTVLKALRLLGEGRIAESSDIASPADVASPEALVEASASAAADQLYRRVLTALRTLAESILRENNSADSTVVQLLEGVRADAMETLQGPTVTSPAGTAWQAALVSVFAGPHHLATLLLRAAARLLPDSAARTPCPLGPQPADWSREMRRIAISQRRPLLWPNHREAIASGFLNEGASAVLSLPTGAGKSVLAELKILANLLCGRRVIYLCTTLALVSQVAAVLKRVFPGRNVGKTFVEAEQLEAISVADIAVMTPERCLTLATAEPEFLEGVGLVVFDECHILSAREIEKDRRSIDAMLTLLTAMEGAPKAEFLLMSAMISNAGALAAWLNSVTERPCHALEIDWKPTRQARGCVVFDQLRLNELSQQLLHARQEAYSRPPKKKKNGQIKAPTPGSAVKRALDANPTCLFGLRHSWDSKSVADYRRLDFGTRKVLLGANDDWHLTTNKNDSAVAILAKASGAGMRAIAFTQSTVDCEAVAHSLAVELSRTDLAGLTQNEQYLADSAADDLGGAGHVRWPGVAVAYHHALLLPAERRLAESAFVRADGPDILVATPTLAQGMNLPAELVVLVGDSRFDADTGFQESLEAHELINAAGRAGRAGLSAHGAVIVIPSELVGVELAQDGTKLGNHWFDVQALFSGGDRCVEIVDPIGILLDLLETVPPESLANVAYFVNRLPTDPDATRRLLRRTFRSFRTSAADRPGFEAKIEKTIVVADQARQTAASHPPWIDDVSSKTGTSVSVLIELMDAVNSADIGQSSVEELANWILDWCDNPGRARALMRSRVFEDLVPGNTPDGRTLKWEHEWQTLRASLRTATQAWLRGQPLSMIDELFQRQRKVGGLRYARKFALRFMPELSFAAGVILGLLRARSEAGEGLSPSIELVTAPPCLRAGLDGPGPLATSYCLREGVSRREARERWAEIAPNVAVLPSDGFGTWIVSVRRALNADEPVAV